MGARKRQSRSKLTKVLVCPDAHHPFVDKKAWDCFLAAAAAWQPDVLIIIGDFIDCYSVSDYPKDPKRTMTLKRELDAGSRALGQLDQLKIPRKIYLEGNHEERLPRCVGRYVPGLDGLFSIPEYLNLEARGWEWVPYKGRRKNWVRIGKFAFAHDIGHAGKTAGDATLRTFGNNIVFGHSHRGGTVYEGNIEGDRHMSLNCGWLGRLDGVDYGSKPQQIRAWQHGFGTVTLLPNGLGWAHFVPIINGTCVLDGQVVGKAAA